MYFWTCLGLATSIPVIYVGSLYLFDRHRLHTDHPKTIKLRLLGACLSTTAICISTYILLRKIYDDPAKMMGLYFDTNTLLNIINALGLTSSIYMGTILMNYLDETLRQCFSFDAWRYSFSDVLWWRNAIIAPLTEELAFRSCLTVLLQHCFGSNVALYFGPMFFSICHYHHIGNDIKHGSTISEAIIGRTVQATYTYVFGMYATFLFFGTNNILPPAFAHALCNQLELPRIFEVNAMKPKSRQPLIYAIHFIGLGLFIYLLPSMGPGNS